MCQDEWWAAHRRQVELGQTFNSLELGKRLAAEGWQLTGRKRKQDKVQAILYLEGFPVDEVIFQSLGLVPLCLHANTSATAKSEP